MIKLLNKYLCFTLGHNYIQVGLLEHFCINCYHVSTDLDLEGLDEDVVGKYLCSISIEGYNL